MFEQSFTDLAAMHFGAGEDGLKVHGLPDGTGFDVLGFERETDLFAGDATDLGIDGQARQPARRFAPGGFGLHDDTGEIPEGFGVGFEVSAATRDFAGETSELPKSDAGGDIAEPVVIPDRRMLVMRSGVTGLGRQEASLLGEFGIIGDKHAPSTGGDDLVAVERMDAGQTERAGRGFAISRAQGFGGVFNQLHAMLVAARLDGGDIRRLTIEVHEDEGLRLLAGFDLLFDDRAGERDIHVPALIFRINEDGVGAEIGDGRSGSDESERRTKHFVAGAHASQTEGEMERGRAGGNGDGMFRADDDGKIFFKRIEIRARRRDPIGLEGFQDVLDFGGTNVGRGKVDTGERHDVKRAKVQIGAELLCKGAKVDSNNT